MRRLATRLVKALAVAAIAAFALAPIIGIVGSSLSRTAFWVFPPRGLTLRWYELFLSRSQLVDSALASLYVAAIVAVIGAAIALLIGLALTRGPLGRRMQSAVSMIVLLPLLIPAVSLGVAIYGLYALYDVPINALTLAAAQLILVIPLIVGLVVIALRNIGGNVERAAANLGALPRQVFWRVTLPLLWPPLISAAILAFVRSLDDAAIALFISSPGTTTLPVRMLVGMENENGSLVAATGSVLLIVAVIAAIVLDRTIGVEKAFGLREWGSR